MRAADDIMDRPSDYSLFTGERERRIYRDRERVVRRGRLLLFANYFYATPGNDPVGSGGLTNEFKLFKDDEYMVF